MPCTMPSFNLFLAHYGHKPRQLRSFLFQSISPSTKITSTRHPSNHQTSFALTARPHVLFSFEILFNLARLDQTRLISFRSERYYHIIRSHQQYFGQSTYYIIDVFLFLLLRRCVVAEWMTCNRYDQPKQIQLINSKQ